MPTYQELVANRRRIAGENDRLVAQADALLAREEFEDADEAQVETLRGQLIRNRSRLSLLDEQIAEALNAPAVRDLMEPPEGREDGSYPMTVGDSPIQTRPAHGRRGPFANFGEQLQAVYRAGVSGGDIDQRLTYRAISGASESVGADGGFLVGEDVSNELLRNVHETGVLVSRVQRRQISSNANRLRIRAFNETSRANGSRLGGIRVYRDGEGDTLTDSKPQFRMIDLELKKMTGLFYATDELLQDTSMLDQEVRSWFEEEFGFKMDDEIINGNGVAEMLGILNSGALVSVAKETGQAAATVVFENIRKMWARMWARSRANAVWLINQDVEDQLFGMSMTVGTGGVPVYMPANGISGAPFATLMGRPVVPVEQCATVGTVGDVILVDLNQYIMAEKGGVQAASSIHVKFLEDETAFRFILRNDGKPRWSSTLTPYKGSNTQSPFIAIATRA